MKLVSLFNRGFFNLDKFCPKNKFQEIFGKLVNLSLPLVNQIKIYAKEREANSISQTPPISKKQSG